MRTRLAYIPELNDFVRVQIIAQHSDGNCSCLHGLTFGFLHKSTMEVPFDTRPRPRKIPFRDPLQLLNHGSSFWGSCVCPSPFPADNGAARWVGQKQLYTPMGQEIATLQPAL